MYLRNTRALAAELGRGGFRDPPWVERWTAAFAGMYLDALRDWTEGVPVARPWQLAFGARPDVPPLQHLLIGLNAHLNFDLPQSLLAVVPEVELDDPALQAAREDDFRRIDALVVHRVPEEYRYLRSVGGPLREEILARLLYPLNLRASRSWLVAARASVWRNALLIAGSRQEGTTELGQRLADLDVLCAAKVAELLRPGPVLLRLTVTGFGVDLPTARPPALGPIPAVPEPRTAGTPEMTMT